MVHSFKMDQTTVLSLRLFEMTYFKKYNGSTYVLP